MNVADALNYPKNMYELKEKEKNCISEYLNQNGRKKWEQKKKQIENWKNQNLNYNFKKFVRSQKLTQQLY